MAEFCHQCSMDLFGLDPGDLAQLCGTGQVVPVLCEGCGPCYVDHKGRSVDEAATASAYRGPDHMPLVLRARGER